jgi:tripartite-type tricarboxylate transporter receptor subunit TctC
MSRLLGTRQIAPQHVIRNPLRQDHDMGCIRAVGFFLIGVASSPVLSQAYPSKSIVFVVPYPAGGGVDLTGRIIAARLSQQLGRTIVIENRPGANGTVGADYVAKAAADGYTLLVGNTGPLSLAPAIYKNGAWSSRRDDPQILVVHPSLPVRSVQDLIASRVNTWQAEHGRAEGSSWRRRAASVSA